MKLQYHTTIDVTQNDFESAPQRVAMIGVIHG